MTPRSLSLLVVAVAGLALPATAFADSTGSAGAVTQLTVYDSSSSQYSQKRGEVVVTNANGSGTTYTWGGSKCSNKNLSSTNVRILADLVAEGATKELTPHYVSGVGSTKCLVAFDIRPAPEPRKSK